MKLRGYPLTKLIMAIAGRIVTNLDDLKGVVGQTRLLVNFLQPKLYHQEN